MSSAGITPMRVAVGLLAGALAAAWLLGGAFAGESARHAEQAAVRSGSLALRALADVVERAGGSGERARAAMSAWAAQDGGLIGLRLVSLEDRSLEFSARPEDATAGPPPRRLAREEKPLFDAAQALRAAVQTNRDEGRAREDEIAVAAAPEGGWLVAAPVELDGAVVGMVEARVPPPAARRRGALGVGLAFAVPVLPFAVLLLLARRRELSGALRWGMLATGLVLLGLSLVVARAHGARAFAAGNAAQETALGQQLRAATGLAAAALHAAGVEAVPPLEPASWDGNRFRQPRGVLSRDGSVDPAALERAAAAWKSWSWGATGSAALAALLLYAAIGLGGAATFWRALARHRVAYAYAVPALLGMLVLVFFPFFYGVALSFTNSNIYNTDRSIREIWVGLDNYGDILGDFKVVERGAEGRSYDYRNFYWTLGFTVVWTVSNVTIGVSVGLALALALNTPALGGKAIYRVLLILPWAVPNYITALIWKGMFHQQFGVVNQVLQIFGAEPISWFERPLTSFATVLTTNGWLSFPFMMVISLGALQSIPHDLYEAARVDGATRWQQFKRITLPLLKPALVPAVILSVIWTFNMFNIIYLVSQGEPAGATEILITEAYKIAFEQYRYGYAAAYSTVIFLILLSYGVWQNRVTRAAEGI